MMTEVIDLEKAAQLVGAQMLPVILARGARCLVWRKQFCIGPVVVGDPPRPTGSRSETPVRVFIMRGIHDVAREANFESKKSGESRNGIGSRWGIVVRGRRVRRSR
jgi:hypothetical protein